MQGKTAMKPIAAQDLKVAYKLGYWQARKGQPADNPFSQEPMFTNYLLGYDEGYADYLDKEESLFNLNWTRP